MQIAGLNLDDLDRWLGPADESAPLFAAVAGMYTFRLRYQRPDGEVGAFFDVEVIDGHAVKVVAAPIQ